MLYVIDFSNFCYKFKCAYKLTTKISGVHVNVSVPFGWIRTLKGLPFNDIIIALDGDPIQMCSYLPSYKGQRSKEPDEEIGFPRKHLISLLTSLGPALGKNIHVAFSPGQEADQVISSVVHMVAKQVTPMQARLQSMQRMKLEDDPYLSRFKELDHADLSSTVNWKDFHSVVVGTTDSDMYQLLRFDNVFLDTSTSGKEIQSGQSTPKMVEFLKPGCIPAYKAFWGDTSDHVPGINLPMKKDDVMRMITDYFSTPQELLKFSDDLKSGKPITNGLAGLANHLIQTNQVSALATNINITYLRYYSDPFYFKETGDLQSILVKYGLHL